MLCSFSNPTIVEDEKQTGVKLSNNTFGFDKNIPVSGAFGIHELIDSYVCIPIRKDDKKSLVKWKNIRKSSHTDQFKGNNLGILTGRTNDLIVIDIDLLKSDNDTECDGMILYDQMLYTHNNGLALETPTCRTQSGGLHLYFKYDSRIHTTTKVSGYSIDVRSDGAYVVAPPSTGALGSYTWVKSLLDTELLDVPDWLFEFLSDDRPKKRTERGSAESDRRSKTKDAPIQKPKSYTYVYDKANILDALNYLPKRCVDSYNDWIRVSLAMKSEGDELKSIWETWSAKSNRYDAAQNEEIWQTLEPYSDLGYLRRVYSDFGLDPTSIKMHRTKFVNGLSHAPDVKVKKRYVTSADVKDGDGAYGHCIMVKSPCGTGKTTMVADIVRDVRAENEGNIRLLSVTCRKSLAAQHVRSFGDKQIDLKCYSDLGDFEMNRSQDLVVQVDSLWRLWTPCWNQNFILVLDEFSALLNYVVKSDTLIKIRTDVMQKLRDLINNAMYIVCTDADLNDMCIDFMRNVGNPGSADLQPHFVLNEWKHQPMKAYRNKTSDDIFRRMCKDVRDGTYFTACYDSKRHMESMIRKLKIYCEENNLSDRLKKFRVYSGDEGDRNDWLDASKNWIQNFVFHSPCITVGLSYDSLQARVVYLISDSVSVNSIVLIQMVMRSRSIKELHYWVSSRYAAYFENGQLAKEYYAQIAQKTIERMTGGNRLAIADNQPEEDTVQFHYRHSDIDVVTDLSRRNQLACGDDVHFRDDPYTSVLFSCIAYDTVLRSATTEQFEHLLAESFEISDAEPIVDAATVGAETRDSASDQINRAFSYEEHALSAREKELRASMVSRAKFLNIPYDNGSV